MDFKVALVGTSQLSFPGDKQSRFGRAAEELRAFLQQMGASLYVYPQTVITPEDAKRSLQAVAKEAPDFLLVQCTSFSAGLLAQIYIRSPYPVGWWGIGEQAKDGAVPFNSYCSVNMYQSIGRTYYDQEKIPSKWFFGEVADPLFAPRMGITVRALRAVKQLCRSRIALIGGIAPGFNDLYFDERKLLRRFPGMEYDRLPEFDDILERAKRYDAAELAAQADAFDAAAHSVHPKAAKHHLLNVRMLRAYKEFAAENRFDALAVSCWPKFQAQLDYSVCSIVARLNDDGLPTACEGDVLSAVSMLLLQSLTQQSAMLMDMSAFDTGDDTALLWHCGPAACNFALDGYDLGVNYHGKAHVPGRGLNSCGVTRDMVFAPNTVTVGRLTGECDGLLVSGGQFIGGEKPSFFGSRGWIGGLSLNGEPISVLDYVNTVLSHGLSHHFPVGMNDVQNELMEAAAWLSMDTVSRVPYRPILQMR